MPRKKLVLTHDFPYHITARSNNRERFYLPLEQCWPIFTHLISQVNLRFHFYTHAFVLMDNHYHLIGNTSKYYYIPKVMEWFQRSANRAINDGAGRINHLFGGPYRASLISSEEYYFHAIKYVFRNPVDAKITARAEDYKYSSLSHREMTLVTPVTGIDSLIPKSQSEKLNWINSAYSRDAYDVIHKGIRKSKFQFSSRIRKQVASELLCCAQSQKVSAYP